MNKNAIQKYAVWARNELIEQVKQRAYQYGINDEDFGDENATVIAGRVLSTDEKRQRTAFVGEIKKNGFVQAVEDVAYTWFNRFVALRFMEVNDYLPTHVRVFSDTSGSFNPEILKDVLHLELEGLDKSKVSELLNDNQTEELYRYLLLTQCNALNVALPEMFEKLGSYTEMLLPNNILKQDSVLARLVNDIDEDDWKDAVQIIGWLYQYYNTEPKQAVFDGLKKNVKITKEKIPAATQLFTPDWIVRYMAENSLGRLWLENHPNDTLKANWKYYLDEAEQTPEVAEELRVMRSQSPVKSPEDICLIDPCMGSGHILVYAFDVLMQIYESEGYNPRDAAKLILGKNIYGLDIDRRAYQLAYFSLMMKARQYNRRIFTEAVKPQVYHPTGFPEGEEYGSLVSVNKLEPMPELPKEQQMTLFDGSFDAKLNAWNFKRLLSQKYDVVVTNPPYMGRKSLNGKISGFIDEYYPNGKSEFYSAFILRCKQLTKPLGFTAMITIHTWMFISSFKKLREELLCDMTISTMVHSGAATFEELNSFNVLATMFCLKNRRNIGEDSTFIRLAHYYNSEDKLANYHNNDNRYELNQNKFKLIPGSPFVYWISEKARYVFEICKSVANYSDPRVGLQTGDNERFVRFWFEICNKKICFDADSNESSVESRAKWFPYNKGGNFRKWYGMNEYVVDWSNNGYDIKNFTDKHGKVRSRPQNTQYYFKSGITWSLFGFENFGVRYKNKGFVFDVSGSSMFPSDDKILYILAFLASKVAFFYLSVLAPTVNFQVGNIGDLPLKFDERIKPTIDTLSKECIDISREDWDDFEESWDFKNHPLCGQKPNSLEEAFDSWKNISIERYEKLKSNEEKINELFIQVYNLQDDLTPNVVDRDIAIRQAEKTRDIKSFISYAVGCMFGRYSLDTEGLAYAGGEWDNDKYKSFIPDKDNILPICDDEYFSDDIIGQFVNFVRVVYGAETLEENLKFIADALGKSGTPREAIRAYFLSDFYKDHCKIYKKRPIYWLFDSGKKNGFKSLVYLHRYQSDLLAKLRTDYVHEQQERYRTQLSHIATTLNNATGSERARLLKQQGKLSEQLIEITAFEEKIHHFADQNIEIDLDDGVKKNYEIFTDVLAKI